MSRRDQYLEVLGIDQWRPRSPAAMVRPVPAPAAPAREAADPALWQALREEVSVCTRCELARGRTQTVFGVGDESGEVVGR